MDKISEKLEQMKEGNKRLLLIIGQPGSGKSKLIHEYSNNTGIPIINFNTIFGEEAKDNIDLVATMKDFLKNYNQEVLLLDNKRILYSKNSKIDMLAFLKDLSNDKIIVSTWNGTIEDGQLVHIRSKAPSDLIYSVEKEQIEYILC